MDPWKAISYVTSPLTLVAFLAAVVAWVYVTQLRRVEKLIASAPEKDRRVLVEGALDVLKVPISKLSATQQFQLTLELIRGRRLKLFSALIAFSLVTLALLGLSLVAFYRLQEPKVSLPSLLTQERRPETLQVLRDYNIYSAEDERLPDALASLATLTPDQVKRLDRIQRIESELEKINSTPSIAALRRRAKNNEPPFQPVGRILRAGVPRVPDDRPSQFFVYVPISADYAGKRIALINLRNDTELRLVAKPAIEDENRDVDLHLNREQARYLFGGDLPKPSANLLVRVMRSGPLFDPSCLHTPRGKGEPVCQKANPLSADLQKPEPE